MKATKAASIAGLAVLTVLCIHTGVRAQQPAQTGSDQAVTPSQPAPADAPPQAQAPQAEPAPVQQPPQPGYPPPPRPYSQEYPPGYAPPPGYVPPQGYGPPPGYVPPPRYYAPRPRYSYYPPPPPPPPPRLSTDRVFMIGGSLGIGGLHYRYPDVNGNLVSSSDSAVGYSGRLGFGLAPRLMLLLEINGAVASVTSNSTTGAYGYTTDYDQTIYDVGLQWFVTRQFFLRGGAGIGNIKGDDGYNYYIAKVGFALTGSIGVELIQGYNWSLELAGQLIAGFYGKSAQYGSQEWTSGAVNVGFNFF
jgi:hypothetical protein